MAEASTLFRVAVALSLLFSSSMAVSLGKTTVLAILSTDKTATRNEEGVLKVLGAEVQSVELLGFNFGDNFEIAFTPQNTKNCENSKRTAIFKALRVSNNRTMATFSIMLDNLDPGEEMYYLCVKQEGGWDFQGFDSWRQVIVQEKESEEGTMLPLPLQITVITLLLFLSGLFSGLNLGLMALDKTELQIIEKCGSQTEKKYAKIIVPLRKRGNYLLCTLLLGNVLVNSTATILFDDLSNGVVAVVLSTVLIVVIGEIIPQAVCSRHGLAVGARTHLITRFFMIVTFPMSFPISLILDKILGEEMGQVYDKEKLQELIRMTADHKVLQNNEANIIAGALQLASKQVEDVMTKMEDVYMLDMNTVLDFEMMAQILKSGYTRVPVYEGDCTNIVNILNTKELALIDPDDNTPVKTVCRFYDHRPLFVDHDVRLDAMLQDFLQGSSHMAIVQKLRNEGDCDPYYENIGVITLEDVIEEIIQNEIIDETDMLTDNRKKKPRERNRQLEYNVFEQKHAHGPKISQQVAFAAYQFLSTAVEPFKEHYIARSVLKQLIRQKVFITLTLNPQDRDKNYLFHRDVECDYFILLLEGHAEVVIGRENLVFECGPFTYFGVECLDCLRDIKMENLKDGKDLHNLPRYVPDFSLRAITPVQFLRIRRVHYLAARRTSYMMSCMQSDDCFHEQTFHDVWHHTMTHTINRNSSTNAINELPDGTQLGALDKRSLLWGSGALRDLHSMDCHHHTLGSAAAKEESDSVDCYFHMDRGGLDSSDHSQVLWSGQDGQASQLVKQRGSGQQTGGGMLSAALSEEVEGENRSGPVLSKCLDVHGKRNHFTKTETDLKEHVAGKAGTGDKISLMMNSKEIRTAPTGETKQLGTEEEEESAPLVNNCRTLDL